jgi:periplasmic divalent cation tolerance protein
MTEYMQVVTTVDSEAEAERLTRAIVGERLAACVQIVGPVRSFYWWKGDLAEGREWQVQMKTTKDRLGDLAAYLKANHGYETPEILGLKIEAGSREYLDWISAETRTGGY